MTSRMCPYGAAPLGKCHLEGAPFGDKCGKCGTEFHHLCQNTHGELFGRENSYFRCPDCFVADDKETVAVARRDGATDALPWPPPAAAASQRGAPDTTEVAPAEKSSSPFDSIDLTAGSPPRNDARVIIVPAGSPRKSPPNQKPTKLQGTMFAHFAEKRGRGRPKKDKKPKPKVVVLYKSKAEEKKAKAAAAKKAKADAAANCEGGSIGGVGGKGSDAQCHGRPH
mmetsp:Transcript_8270/g.23055  ORF Transcript_8270/g.23055 Transcript_8270/m.23055 type:complete len:225 (+) Transcript_8270:234-908(+)